MTEWDNPACKSWSVPCVSTGFSDLAAAGNSGGPLLDARNQVLGLNTLLSKKPGDKANETDRAISVRMDFITRILASK